MKNKGWVRLHRKIEDNSLWFLEPFTKAQAWIDLFLNANHHPATIQIRGNLVSIKRGQIGWSELTMAQRWKWSKNKVRRFLKLLETEQQIEQQKDRYITTIITILNYNKMQNDTADDTAERQQKDSRRYINKNDKNEKNEKNENKDSSLEGDNKPITSLYGEFKNVFLTAEEYKKLLEKFGEVSTKDKIEALGQYLASKGKKYKDHYATILSWDRKNAPKPPPFSGKPPCKVCKSVTWTAQSEGICIPCLKEERKHEATSKKL